MSLLCESVFFKRALFSLAWIDRHNRSFLSIYLRLAILDNSKWNANKILRGSASALYQDIKFSKVNYYVKKHGFSTDATIEMIEEIVNDNDIVLTAIGDCGSCCSSCIRDAVALEDRGIPAAPVITTEFVNETKLTRVAIGMPDLKPVVIDLSLIHI